MSNGELIKQTFPNATICLTENLGGMQCVVVDFGDQVYGSCYALHTFSKEWWEAEANQDSEQKEKE